MSRIIAPLLFMLLCANCDAPAPVSEPTTATDQTDAALAVLSDHLAALSNQDLAALSKTLDPGGEMTLILPGQENTYRVQDFMDFHETWFQDTTWSFSSEILRSTVHGSLATAIVEAMYREPERDGVPYFNRMMVTYSLEKKQNGWFVTQDHASSVEKSTDQRQVDN